MKDMEPKNFFISKEDNKKLKQYCIDNDIKFESIVIRKAIKEYINERNK